MPEFTVKEVRLPELHLPEIKREEIVRSLSGVRLPEVDLAGARRATIKVPAIGVSGSDVGKLLAAAAAVARLARPTPSRSVRFGRILASRSRSPLTRIVQPRRRRSRTPIAIGALVILAVAAWAILRRPQVRRRIAGATQAVRTGIEAPRDLDPATAMEALESVSPETPEMASADGADLGEPDPSGPPTMEETTHPM